METWTVSESDVFSTDHSRKQTHISTWLPHYSIRHQLNRVTGMSWRLTDGQTSSRKFRWCWSTCIFNRAVAQRLKCLRRCDEWSGKCVCMLSKTLTQSSIPTPWDWACTTVGPFLGSSTRRGRCPSLLWTLSTVCCNVGVEEWTVSIIGSKGCRCGCDSCNPTYSRKLGESDYALGYVVGQEIITHGGAMVSIRFRSTSKPTRLLSRCISYSTSRCDGGGAWWEFVGTRRHV